MSKSKEESATKTDAEKIWQEIKDKPIEMFSLPSQKVHQYCTPVSIEPAKLYLQASATSVLPALEAALGPKFSIERMERFLVVSRSK